MFVDSHCHIDFPDFAERVPQLLDNMRDNQVTHALCISVTLEDFPRVLALAERYPNLYASVGVHPDHEEGEDPTLERLVALSNHPRVVGTGETGLDYYRLNGRSIDDMEWQRERFRTHIRAARHTRKPLIIHTRSSADDTLRVMRDEDAGEVGGVMHCFTETWDVARQSLDEGFHISFSGIVTFKSAADLQETARKVPLDRMLIETDSPYLAPVPYRGKTNEPAWVRHVGEFIANLRGIPVEQLAEQTTENFFNLFKHIDRNAHV
ncbi:TatD family hydrolase [Cupriavidus plantarum]|uniref:TatD DNase family protein n=1 Tax=Cupriavidus plantarum TaxID=942865 RepID=A0A316EYU3_9BURK|nr:TatD family hydrolase [Cupriavidus plantarum]PWK37212.1 TatD DNase family protein [Cupriavidus plantarum]REF02051.1 TatD DNase family protein [Cupriavidus plantarum]